MGPLGKTLMSIDAQQEQDDKVREDLNVQRRLGCMRGTGPRATGLGVRFFGACEGQALALRLRRRADRATVVRWPVRRNRVLILFILFILAILLQTERVRGTGPRATGGPRAPVVPEHLIRTCL